MASWKMGFEIELLAPQGRSRRDLAAAVARDQGGTVGVCFYPQSEPSLVPGLPVFENLVLGFDVRDRGGERIALLVDDLTIRDGLDHNAPPLTGWLRLLSDDARLLSLAQHHCDPQAGLEAVLEPVAALWGTPVEHAGGGITKVVDQSARSIAMAAPLPGERERPCEIISPPYGDDPEPALRKLLMAAHALDFSVPAEAALHIHYDAVRLRDARALARLIKALDQFGDALRSLVRTNPRCVRLGPISDSIRALARDPDFQHLDWIKAQQRLIECKPTKYADYNFFNLAHDLPGKQTFEVRIFPGSMDVSEIMRNARLFAAILEWACGLGTDGLNSGFPGFLATLKLPPEDLDQWHSQLPDQAQGV